jgi:hypothetical protein
MFSPPALGPPGGLGAGTKDTLASLGHDGGDECPFSVTHHEPSPASAGLFLGRLSSAAYSFLSFLG